MISINKNATILILCGLSGLFTGVLIMMLLFEKDMLHKRQMIALLEVQTASLAVSNAILQEKNIQLADKVSDFLKPGNGIKANGWLSVRGTSLYNHSGQKVQLKGMSSHGLRWFPEYINAGALQSTKKYGANLFRAAMYADSEHGAYNADDESKILNKLFLFMAVENALANDMYVIIDWHLLKDFNPLKNINNAIDFFDEMAYRYKNEAGVIYEICNEPNGSTSWNDIKIYAAQVIPVIRRHAPKSIILVGTPKFCSDLQGPLNEPLPYDNIMYTFHLYTGESNYEWTYILSNALKENLPIFVSEWGISKDASTSRLDLDEAQNFINFMHQHNISWANWSLSNKNEDFSALKPSTVTFSNWAPEELSEAGRLVFQAFTDGAAAN